MLAGLVRSAEVSERLSASRYNPLAAPPLSGLSSKYVALFTFGHKDLYDDISLLWMLQAVLDVKSTAEPEAVMTYIRSVLHPRPHVETMYMLACFIMNEDFKRPDLCEEIIMAGLETFPDSWRLPMTQGYIFAASLKQPAQAARFYHIAASRPNSPEYVGELAAKLVGEYELTEDDIKKSLGLMFSSPQGEGFAEFLSRHRQPKEGTAP